MIEFQKQQKQTNVPNRSRRTPLNVVVEKIGSSAVVHGNLGKESLKELLMSELSLISKYESPETKDSTSSLENTSENTLLTQGFSEIISKAGDKKNISEKSKSEEEMRELNIGNERKAVESDKEKQEVKSIKDPMKFDKISQEKDNNITKELQKSQKDIFENEVTNKEVKEDQDMKNKTNENEKKDQINSSNEDFSIHGKAGKVMKKVDTKNEDKEKDSGKEITENEFEKGDYDTKFQDKEKGTLKCQSNKETIRKTENILQDKRKKEEADDTVKYLFQKKDSKLRGKKCMSKREKREKRRAIMKDKSSRYYGDLDDDKTKQIEEISDFEDFANDSEKKERGSCFSKRSSDIQDILALSYDGKWLRQYLRKPLFLAMNEIVKKKPRDPVNYLGFWLLNYRKAQESLKRKMDLEEELLSKRN
ncbi:DNA ligase 1-like [Belonocnema kinseyi]|uniref:DNA ligase 1-like n=1 Tax=Belonocnema kinseyi TaxID=2817044 RepID=UPI00143D5601|nr:DNA ligase 1-like [Belonocnema kinseyi]XP_033214778.1 DNA ligase 1-like [Belonocnema kinseyi]XP_033214779.1 DNA ligase 1-like [Belonocnema kinseyi]